VNSRKCRAGDPEKAGRSTKTSGRPRERRLSESSASTNTWARWKGEKSTGLLGSARKEDGAGGNPARREESDRSRERVSVVYCTRSRAAKGGTTVQAR